MSPEPTPIRNALDTARAFAANVIAVGHAEEADRTGLAAMTGGYGRTQAAHADMARTFALVSIAESLAEIARTLRSGVISTQGVEV